MYELIRKLRRTSADRTQDDKGFTLLELMVVVLIIGILLAFAIPQFLKARSGSQEKQAQSNVRVALSASAQYLEDQGSYAGLDDATIVEYENSVDYAATSDAAGTIGVVATQYDLTLVARSDSGYCYFINSIISDAGGATTGTTYGVGDEAGGVCTPDIANANLSTDTNPKIGWDRTPPAATP